MDNASNPDEDLFGSDDGSAENKVHELSDRELDSGDDEGQDNRPRQKSGTEEREGSARANAAILDSTVWRHPLPRPFDREVRSYTPQDSRRSLPRCSLILCDYQSFLV